MTTRAETPNSDSPPSIPPACLRRMSVRPVRYLGGRVNQHWLVESDDKHLVLRGYAREQSENAGYEHEVLRRLRHLGWPVPELVREPVRELDQLWCLFTLLPGASHSNNGPEERRSRGRLLAELHESMASLANMGQRSGFRKADELIFDSALLPSIRNYERIRPAAGHVLRWHLEKARELFERINLEKPETTVLHGDFAPWNILFEDGKLSGIIDFEATHLNYRVSDFALAWRGYQDEVIEGYEEVHPLTELDRHVLIPAYWSWLFLGVKEEIDAMVSGRIPAHDFDWQIKKLLLRSALHPVEPYPGIN